MALYTTIIPNIIHHPDFFSDTINNKVGQFLSSGLCKKKHIVRWAT